MSEQVVIYFKNGTKDWIDPIIEINEDDNKLIIDNGYVHEFDMNDIDRYEVILLGD